MKLSFTLCICAVLGMSSIISCKKKTDQQVPGYRLSKVIEIDGRNDSIVYTIKYNSSGQVSFIHISDGSSITYTHFSNFVIIKNSHNEYYDSIAKNDRSMAGARCVLRARPGKQPELSTQFNFDYGKDELLDHVSIPGSNDVYNYYSTKGNLDSMNYMGSDGDKFLYDLAHLSQPGDVQMWQQLIFYGGVNYHKSVHLWRGQQLNPYSYTFDASNRIESATPDRKTGGMTTYLFQYEDY